MTEIPLHSNIQLNQALNQLAKAAPNSEVARQAIEVVVRHLEGNQFSLSPTTSAQVKAALLPTKQLQGSLNSGQTYQVNLKQDSTDLLQFFSKTATGEISKLPLTDPLSQTLLKLPANQLNHLLDQYKLEFAGANTAKSANLFTVLQGTIANTASDQQLTRQLSINLIGSKPSQTITLPLSSNVPAQKGDSVSIDMLVKGKNWQLIVKPLENNPSLQSRATEQVSLSDRKLHEHIKTRLGSPEGSLLRGELSAKMLSTNQPSANLGALAKLTLTPEDAAALVKTVMQQQANKQPIDIPLPLKTLINQLTQHNTPNNQAILAKVLNLLPEKISLQFSANGNANLHIQHPKLVANIPLTSSQLEHLSALKIVDKMNVNTHLHQATDRTSTGQLAPVSPATLVELKQQVQLKQAGDAPLPGKDIPGKDIPGKDLLGKALPGNPIKPEQMLEAQTLKTINEPQSAKRVSSAIDIGSMSSSLPAASAQSASGLSHLSPHTGTPNAKSYPATLPDFKIIIDAILNKTSSETVVTNEFVNSKPAQLTMLQNLLRLAQPKAELPSVVLNNFEKLLTESATQKTLAEPATQSWLKQVVQEIRQATPQGKEQDAANIKQLMSAPSLPLSAVQIISPPATQGMLSGLVTLLQVSLASRLLRNQPSQAERLAQILPSIFSEPTKGELPANPAKALQEFSQLEQRSQLIREISRLLADHQSNKLANSEKLLQGQETYYYNLPSLLGDKFNNIELLVKREEQHKEDKAQNASTPKTWQLTMKLSVGELGELLTKAKLRPDEVEIDFYASNDSVKHQVMNFMPLLKKRLASLGIEVAKSQCQLGKIPDTLADRPYHIFQTQA